MSKWQLAFPIDFPGTEVGLRLHTAFQIPVDMKEAFLAMVHKFLFGPVVTFSHIGCFLFLKQVTQTLKTS